jgi:putative redox protein
MRERKDNTMIVTSSETTPYRTRFSSGGHDAYADTTVDKGGGGSGFRPHELLEAALATCVNMHVRMYADGHGIALGQVSTTVVVDRSQPSNAVFKYTVELAGQLSTEERRKLIQIAETCPVRKTLSRTISFQGP